MSSGRSRSLLDRGLHRAHAHALLRCGTPEELAEHPTVRLRLTLGLRREDGRWLVAHEDHAFPHAFPPD